MRRVCLVGAGGISATHAEALRRVPGVQLAAVVDPNLEAARRLAADWSVPEVFRTARDAIGSGAVDAAHVLVPPGIHGAAALPFLEAGTPVLLEKPLAASSAECDQLLAASRRSGALLGVNQNFLFHPAFLRLRRLVATGRVGRIRFVDCIYNLSLRQLAARQFGHWMFDAPLNLLLEQAVHPLSQVVALAGPVGELRAIAGAPVRIGPALDFHPDTTVALACGGAPAQLRFAVGQSFPFWQVSVVCDDGVVVADILANRVTVQARTERPDILDGVVGGGRIAGSAFGAAVRNLAEYGLSTLSLLPRSDPFFRSMRGSIAAYHAALDGSGAFQADGAFGAGLVGICERIRDCAYPTRPGPGVLPRRGPAAPALPQARCDVAVLGGTGFIGAHTVGRFLRQGIRVAVMARSVRNLPAPFDDGRVVLHRGSIGDEVAVAEAIGDAPVVVNLAHGGGGRGFAEIERAMVGGAEVVARACQARAVRRMIHAGTIASLYLGSPDGVVTGATPTDPQLSQRADYARAKAIAERRLLELHAAEGLPVCILRPGLVVGEGTAALHSGLGYCNNDQHCIGWNGGRNPLPFVLVRDVAEAIVLACHAPGIEGRCYNLVGDVRPSARAFVADMAAATGRPLRFHPSIPWALWGAELGKWAIKRAGGRAAPLPSRRDLLSRGLLTPFDCSDARRDLGWRPCADPAEFAREAFAPHAR